MKKLFTIIGIALLTATALAQSPQKMSYQAVIRNSSNQLVTSQAVGMKISILQGSTTGTAVYTETITPIPNTNANGLVSIVIGGGTGFDAINWANGLYFIKTETDPIGGTNYTITGTSQLLSVPYALYASKVSNLSGTNTGDETTTTIKSKLSITTLSGSNTGDQDGSETKVTAGTNISVTGSGTSASPYVVNVTGGSSYYLGQQKDGGVIFNIYKGSDGLEHGLIVSRTESLSSLKWQNTAVRVYADRTWDGTFNTTYMTDSPAKDYATGLGTGWYIPSIDELRILFNNRFIVNKSLSGIGGSTFIPDNQYWSSTENGASEALCLYFYSGLAGNSIKTNTNNVRAIRSF